MSSLNISQRLWQIADGTVQRALESLANTYDAALKALNKSFDFTDGTTTVRNSLSVLGSLTAQNVAAQAITATSVASTGAVSGATVASAGAITAASVTSTGAVSAGSVASSGAVTAGTVTATGAVSAGSVSSSGAVSGAAVSSGIGFKTLIGPYQRSNAAFATSTTSLVWGLDNSSSGTSTTLVQGVAPPVAGSIVGISVSGQAGPNAPMTFTVYKNGAATAAVLNATLSGGNSASAVTFAKGAVPFVPGDRLDMYYLSTVTSTGQFVATFTIEMAA